MRSFANAFLIKFMHDLTINLDLAKRKYSIRTFDSDSYLSADGRRDAIICHTFIDVVTISWHVLDYNHFSDLSYPC
jgi:hypothetical protein